MPSSSRMYSCIYDLTSVPLSVLAHPWFTLQSAGRGSSGSHRVTLPALYSPVVESASPHLASRPCVLGWLRNTFPVRPHLCVVRVFFSLSSQIKCHLFYNMSLSMSPKGRSLCYSVSCCFVPTIFSTTYRYFVCPLTCFHLPLALKSGPWRQTPRQSCLPHYPRARCMKGARKVSFSNLNLDWVEHFLIPTPALLKHLDEDFMRFFS